MTHEYNQNEPLFCENKNRTDVSLGTRFAGCLLMKTQGTKFTPSYLHLELYRLNRHVGAY